MTCTEILKGETKQTQCGKNTKKTIFKRGD